MTTTTTNEANVSKELANETTTVKAKREYYMTANGLKTSKVLKPRQASGMIGEITCNLQFTDTEMIGLIKWLKLDHFHKSSVEESVLQQAGLTRVIKQSVAIVKKTAVADNTKVFNDELLDRMREARNKNKSFDEIRARLGEFGITEQVINEHFEVLSKLRPVEPVIPQLF